MEMAKLLAKENRPEEALRTAKANYGANAGNCIVGLHYANILRQNNKYRETLKVLGKIEMLPAESDKWSGEIDSHSLFRETNITCALDAMKSGKWKKALTFLQTAETWPQNLGWGEPYYADNRLTKFFAAYCSGKMKDTAGYDSSMKYISGYSNPDGPSGHMENQLAEMIKKGDKDFRAITEALVKDNGKNSEVELLKKFLTIL